RATFVRLPRSRGRSSSIRRAMLERPRSERPRVSRAFHLLMRVALVSVYSHPGCTLKDVAGGFGTRFEVGSSLGARLLERAKSRVAVLPPLVLGYLSAQLRAAGHDVRVHDLRAGAPLPSCDAAVVLSSITDATEEARVCERLRSRGVRTVVVGAYASA